MTGPARRLNPKFPETDPQWLRGFRRRLLAWFDAQGRPLPWRATRDAYRVWISEIMLQQTTVAAVVPFYQRFLAAFPTVQALAAAEEAAVLRAWEGLGYYSRARNLHATAKQIVGRGGAFPQTVAELIALPGIGRYTAGAVASFAFDVPAPIVEANTLRLYSRLIGYEDDPRATAGQTRLWEFAGRIVPQRSAGRFNQAVMELGGTVCTPAAPDCGVCPVRVHCRAFATQAQDRIPQPRVRPTMTDITDGCVAARNAAGAFLLRRRAVGERWAGLWDFPRGELGGDDLADFTPLVGTARQPALPLHEELPASLRQRLTTLVREQTGLHVEIGQLLADLRHGVTRYRIHLFCFAGRVIGGEMHDGVMFAPVENLADVPLTTPARRLVERLRELSLREH